MATSAATAITRATMGPVEAAPAVATGGLPVEGLVSLPPVGVGAWLLLPLPPFSPLPPEG